MKTDSIKRLLALLLAFSLVLSTMLITSAESIDDGEFDAPTTEYIMESTDDSTDIDNSTDTPTAEENPTDVDYPTEEDASDEPTEEDPTDKLTEVITSLDNSDVPLSMVYLDDTGGILEAGQTETVSGNIHGDIFINGGTLVLENPLYKITGTITIANNGHFFMYDSAVDGTVTINSQGRFSMYDGTITGAGRGVTINTGGRFDMQSGTITKNTAVNGGGVLVTGSGAEFYMTGGTISDNISTPITATDGGGGVAVKAGAEFHMTGGVIRNNTTEATAAAQGQGGGGVLVDNHSTFRMDNEAKIMDNIAGNGGGVHVHRNSNFIMHNGIISGNHTRSSAYANGGGVVVRTGSTFTMHDGEISGNWTLYGAGGGVRVSHNNASFDMQGGVISHNKANGIGGGVSVHHTANFTMYKATIRNNESSGAGGGVNISGNSIFTMEDSHVINNNASAGGGLLVQLSTATLENSTMSGNTSRVNGGGAAVMAGANLNMVSSVIDGNNAGTAGGGVAIVGAANTSTFTLTSGEIRNNKAMTNGGGIDAANANLVVINGEISNNTAEGSGGGIFVGGAIAGRGASIHAGTINNNTAMHGGGIGVAEVNLHRITTGHVYFNENVATFGMRINHHLYEQYRDQISSETISSPGGILQNSHVFSNYDVQVFAFFVTFDGNEDDDGTNMLLHVPMGFDVPYPPTVTREGYIFDGWFESYENESMDAFETVTRNLEFIAQWQVVNPPSEDVTDEATDEDAADTDEVDNNTNENVYEPNESPESETSTNNPANPQIPSIPGVEDIVNAETPISGGISPDVAPVPMVPGNQLVQYGDMQIEMDEMGIPLGAWSWDDDDELWIFDDMDIPLDAFSPSPAAGLAMMPQTGLERFVSRFGWIVGIAFVIGAVALVMIKCEKAKRIK